MCDVSIVVYCIYGWWVARGEYKGAWEMAGTVYQVNGGRFEINQLLFSGDTALVADSEEKLYRLVSEFRRVCEEYVRVCESRKWCSMYVNMGRMVVRLNSEKLEEGDFLSTGRKWQRMEVMKGMWHIE